MVNSKVLFFAVFFLIFFHFASANFVCGDVMTSDDTSPYWMDVFVYYSESPDEIVRCNVNAENKYCCDLDEVISVKWSSGKVVFAEVYDIDTGYVSDVVSLVTTDEAYDVFPTLNIEPAILFDLPLDRIMVDRNHTYVSGVLHPRYDNLRIHVGEEAFDVCTNCDLFNYTFDLSPGKNDVTFEVYGDRDIEKDYSFFALDYFEVERSFECDKCSVKKGKTYVPANSVVDVVLKINSSHELSEEVMDFIPADWILVEDDYLIDFSESHSFWFHEVDGTNSEIRYRLKTPNNLVQSIYNFETNFFGIVSQDEVYISRMFWFWLPIYFEEEFDNYTLYEVSLLQQVYPEYPFVVKLNGSSMNVLAIYPEKDGLFRGIVRAKEPFLFGSRTEYQILSSFSDEDISKVLVQFKVDSGDEVWVEQNEEIIDLQLLKIDENEAFYQGVLPNKDKFYLVKK